MVVADLNEERAAAVAEEIGGSGVGVDVTDEASVEGIVARAGELRPLRISVTSAGIGTPGKLVGRDGPSPLESFARVIAVNHLGTINVLRCAAGTMVGNEPGPDGDRGICVNTASIAAYEGKVGQVAYAASKGGVASLTLPVARELAPREVRVATIAPGLFETPMMAGLPETVRRSLGKTVPYPRDQGTGVRSTGPVQNLIP